MYSIKSFIILFALLNLPLNCYATNDFPPGNYKIGIAANTRPSSPYPPLDNYNRELTNHGTGSIFTVRVTRHHIIPYQLLRDFYNMVTTNGDLARFRGFFLTMGNSMPYYASSNSVDCSGGSFSDITAAATLAEAFGSLYVNGGGQVPPPGLDTFQQFYTWLPGNLFIGPSARSDDLHDGMAFEQHAVTVVGRSRFIILQRAYNNLIDYVRHGNRAALGAIVADLSRVATIRSIYELDPTNWVLESGQYRLHNNAPRKMYNESKAEKNNRYIETCGGIKSGFTSMRNRYYYRALVLPYKNNEL